MTINNNMQCFAHKHNVQPVVQAKYQSFARYVLLALCCIVFYPLTSITTSAQIWLSGERYPCPNTAYVYAIIPPSSWTVINWQVIGAVASVVYVPGSPSALISFSDNGGFPCTVIALMQNDTSGAQTTTSKGIFIQTNNYSVSIGNGPSFIPCGTTPDLMYIGTPSRFDEHVDIVQYSWVIPTGWTADRLDNRYLRVKPNETGTGNIVLTTRDKCGNIKSSSFPITRIPTLQPIAGQDCQCINVDRPYSVPDVAVAGTTYNWTVTGGLQIVSGQGTTNVMVRNNGGGGTLSVIAQTPCGNTNQVSKSIQSVSTVPAFRPVTNEERPCPNFTRMGRIRVVNPEPCAVYYFIPETPGIIFGGGTVSNPAGTGDFIHVEVDTYGRKYSYYGVNDCGAGATYTNNQVPLNPSCAGDDGNPLALRAGQQITAEPNPFQDNTTLSYDLSGASVVTLDIVNNLNQVVRSIYQNERQKQGKQSVVVSARGLQTGSYTVRLVATNQKGETIRASTIIQIVR